MKVLSAKLHGYFDFLAVLAFWVVPSLAGFAPAAQSLSYSIGWAYLGLALLTAYPYGIIKLIPFTVHGAIEFLTSIALVAAPWLGGFAGDSGATTFYVIMGIGLFGLWAVTDYRVVSVTPMRRQVSSKTPGTSTTETEVLSGRRIQK